MKIEATPLQAEVVMSNQISSILGVADIVHNHITKREYNRAYQLISDLHNQTDSLFHNLESYVSSSEINQ